MYLDFRCWEHRLCQEKQCHHARVLLPVGAFVCWTTNPRMTRQPVEGEVILHQSITVLKWNRSLDRSCCSAKRWFSHRCSRHDFASGIVASSKEWQCQIGSVWLGSCWINLLQRCFKIFSSRWCSFDSICTAALPDGYWDGNGKDELNKSQLAVHWFGLVEQLLMLEDLTYWLHTYLGWMFSPYGLLQAKQPYSFAFQVQVRSFWEKLRSIP